jgi:hypothetical protein
VVRNAYRSCFGNLKGNVHLENHEVCGRKISRLILELRKGGGWNWLRIDFGTDGVRPTNSDITVSVNERCLLLFIRDMKISLQLFTRKSELRTNVNI